LFFVALPLLFWNEGRAVTTALSLEEGLGAVVTVAADKVDPANENKLVHMSASTKVEGTLSDDEFGVSAPAVRLRRSVEMFQWQEEKKSEEKKKLGGGTETVTTYNYKKVWSSVAIDSGSFKKSSEHQNPGSIPYSSKSFEASQVQLGAFTLSPSLVGKISNWTPVDPASKPATGEAVSGTTASGTTTAPMFPGGLKAVNGKLYSASADPSNPKIGDIKISFEAVLPSTISIIAQQTGQTFRPYQTKAGDSLEMLDNGNRSAQEMFASAQSANTMMTWGLRIFGFLLMYIGISMIFNPLVVLADVIPFFGNLMGAGVGMLSFFLAAPLSLTMIAIGWIAYRPVLGIALLVFAVAIFVGGFMMMRGKKPAAAPLQA
ncbi:MAG TPA: TMEM43 family protein, partial [Candidatus Ozemobacteraceae bacterium]|nr:TMEM43 family protein [Candidatus Ozemobacteraceae bacterium]